MTKKLFAIAICLIAIASAYGQEMRRWVITEGPDKRAFIGAALTGLTPELREFFGAPSEAGVLVASVTENGPAAKAGLRVGDVITAVDGNRIGESFNIAQAMKGKHAGDTVRLDIVRNHNKQSLVVTAEERDVREFRRTFTLGDMEHQLGRLDGGEWRALIASPDTEDLRARIRDLEQRLQELEKKLQQK
jgi:membrane-associated protease RseP (regulator of RpoE activity)